jgi:hypothetical protein
MKRVETKLHGRVLVPSHRPAERWVTPLGWGNNTFPQPSTFFLCDYGQ